MSYLTNLLRTFKVVCLWRILREKIVSIATFPKKVKVFYFC